VKAETEKFSHKKKGLARKSILKNFILDKHIEGRGGKENYGENMQKCTLSWRSISSRGERKQDSRLNLEAVGMGATDCRGGGPRAGNSSTRASPSYTPVHGKICHGFGEGVEPETARQGREPGEGGFTRGKTVQKKCGLFARSEKASVT